MSELFRTFGRIGLLSFGGPAAQIALMHRVLVDEKAWMKESEFLNALSFSMLLPGPEAMQLATYAGWRKAGVRGGLLAGGLFVLPGAIVMAVLAVVYAQFGQNPLLEAVFLGVQAAVIAIVLEALLKVAKKALHSRADWFVALLSFVAIFLLSLPFPLIVAIAACFGFLVSKSTSESPPDLAAVPQSQTLLTAITWLGVWFLPLPFLFAFGPQLLIDISIFFSTLAIVTFGGAYAVLAYMAQTVVADFGWITTEDMMTGLGLAETTPGPLILVTEFVGFLSGYREGGYLLAVTAAAVTLWMTFVPCFLWIFVGAPYVERLLHMPRLSGALKAVTAAVVGVILNLSIWFAVHIFFEDVGMINFGLVSLLVPNLSTANYWTLGIAALLSLLVLKFKIGIGLALILGAAMGVISLLPFT